MKQKAVTLNLRVARDYDFSDNLKQKKYGCMYFQQSINGTFCNQPYFFNENTDMEVFRQLYRSKQIWVLAGIFDEVEIIDKRKPIKTNVRTKQKRVFSNGKGNANSFRPCTCRQKQSS